MTFSVSDLAAYRIYQDLGIEGHEPQIFVPDGSSTETALSRVTHLWIGAHQDDAEVADYYGIRKCYESKDEHFCAITLANGRGSPLVGEFANMDAEEMVEVRRHEQIEAAIIGKYSAVIQTMFPSRIICDKEETAVTSDLVALIRQMPNLKVIHTHNPADKHDTHVAVACRVKEALQQLPERLSQLSVNGIEVWRKLDWMVDHITDNNGSKISNPGKVMLDVSANPASAPNLDIDVLLPFRSQNTTRDYAIGSQASRESNGVFGIPHDTCQATRVTIAMDLMPAILGKTTYAGLTFDHIMELQNEQLARIARHEKASSISMPQAVQTFVQEIKSLQRWH